MYTQIGIDIGYSHTKLHMRSGSVMFPSVVGTAEQAAFSIGESEQSTVLTWGGSKYQVGTGAIAQSRFLNRREDRQWFQGDEWYTLYLAALAAAGQPEIGIVTGLPVAFFAHDKDDVRNRMLGEHWWTRNSFEEHTMVMSAHVIPQPFGLLCSQCLDQNGAIVDAELATSRVGCIDVGGKTCNLLSVNRLSSVTRETASVNLGAWDAVRAVREQLALAYPDLELRDHEIVDAILDGHLFYYGEKVELGEIANAVLRPMAAQVVAEATQLWNGGAGLSCILIGGGGGALLGPFVREAFPHARLVDQAQQANARGYYYLAQHLLGLQVE